MDISYILKRWLKAHRFIRVEGGGLFPTKDIEPLPFWTTSKGDFTCVVKTTSVTLLVHILIGEITIIKDVVVKNTVSQTKMHTVEKD